MDDINTELSVLVVDDSRTMIMIVKKFLRQLGFDDIDVANSGAQARQMLVDNNNYGLLISDWQMEDGTGKELLEFVRNKSKNKDIPFIMMTGDDVAQRMVKGALLGASSFLQKPFNVDSLSQEIANVLGTV